MAEEMKPLAAGDAPAPAPHVPEYPLDFSRLSEVYANFCRVTRTPEVMVLDFGLNTQVTTNPTEPIKITHRLVMNYFTAKRLLVTLHMAVQQYENAFGVIEIDVNRRARPRPPQSGIRPT